MRISETKVNPGEYGLLIYDYDMEFIKTYAKGIINKIEVMQKDFAKAGYRNDSIQGELTLQIIEDLANINDIIRKRVKDNADSRRKQQLNVYWEAIYNHYNKEPDVDKC